MECTYILGLRVFGHIHVLYHSIVGSLVVWALMEMNIVKRARLRHSRSAFFSTNSTFIPGTICFAVTSRCQNIRVGVKCHRKSGRGKRGYAVRKYIKSCTTLKDGLL